MDWQEQLISLYLFVCKHYQNELWVYNQRMGNYANLSFTDEEVITLYLFGIIDGRRSIKKIYEYADRHLRAWFPSLPSYVAYVQRLNQAAEIFPPLLEKLQLESETSHINPALLIDSFPVVLAKQGRRFKAKVAPELASSGYCSTKKLYYYGVKVHIAGRNQHGTLPIPEFVGVYGASEHDGKVFDQIRPEISGEIVFGDKAYARPDATEIKDMYNLSVLTPVKKEKGQKYLDAADQWLSSAVSSVRQPIESLFNWIEEKTGIEAASKVRSYSGLLVHVFGRLTAGLFYWNKIRMV